MAAHTVKCKKCGKYFDTNKFEFIKEKNRYSHKICPDLTEEEMSKLETEQSGDKKLASYILETYGDSVYKAKSTWVIFAKYKKEYGLSGLDLYHIIYYLVEIKKRNLEKGFGLIPYYIDEAKNYFNKIEAIQNTNETKIQTEEIENEVIEVTILSPQRKKKLKKLFTFLDEVD